MPARTAGLPEGTTIIPPPAGIPPVQIAPVPAPMPAPPSAAPHSQAAQSSEEEARNGRLRAKAEALRNAPRAIPINDIAVIIGMKTKQGRQEVMYDIGPEMRILDVTHGVKEKVRAVTEEGKFLGFEPTGEYEFTLKVKYLKE